MAWFKGKKSIIGVGMIPRCKEGLIFGWRGLSSGVFDVKLFGAVNVMIMVRTVVAPPILRSCFRRKIWLGSNFGQKV